MLQTIGCFCESVFDDDVDGGEHQWSFGKDNKRIIVAHKSWNMPRVIEEQNNTSLRAYATNRSEQKTFPAVKQYRKWKKYTHTPPTGQTDRARVEGDIMLKSIHSTHTHSHIFNGGYNPMVRKITQNIKFNTWLANVRIIHTALHRKPPGRHTIYGKKKALAKPKQRRRKKKYTSNGSAVIDLGSSSAQPN